MIDFTPAGKLQNINHGIYRIFHLKSKEHAFFSVARGMFPKTDNILGHKARLTEYQQVSLIPCILPDHNGITLQINVMKSAEYKQT